MDADTNIDTPASLSPANSNIEINIAEASTRRALTKKSVIKLKDIEKNKRGPGRPAKTKSNQGRPRKSEEKSITERGIKKKATQKFWSYEAIDGCDSDNSSADFEGDTAPLNEDKNFEKKKNNRKGTDDKKECKPDERKRSKKAKANQSLFWSYEANDGGSSVADPVGPEVDTVAPGNP